MQLDGNLPLYGLLLATGSPYVSLNDWEGISCYDCGYTVARSLSGNLVLT